MALLRSMSTGVSGLRAQQTAIDVVGHNIANATTTAYKAGRVDFSTLLSQTLRFGTAPSGASGGVNPQQVGLGVRVGSVQYNFNDGARRATGIATDLAVEGSGFFILQDTRGSGRAFTRDGSFTLNSLGELIDPSGGFRVQGYMSDLDPSREVTAADGTSDFVINNTGAVTSNITIPLGELRIARETSNVTFGGNLNSGGELADMATILESEQLYERVGGILVPATETTLLDDLVRTSDGTALGTQIQLGMDAGATVNVRAQIGGRVVDRQFTVGAPKPMGGTTLGDLRDFLRGALGIYKSGEPGQEAYSSIRNHAVTGDEVSGALQQLGERGYATLTLNGLLAGQTITIGGQSLVAGTDFTVGASDAETAANLATAINLNTVLGPQVIASVVAPTGGPVQVRLAQRIDGAPALALDTSASAGAIQTTGMITLGSGIADAVSDGDTITLTDGATTVTFEFDDGSGVVPGNTAVTLGATSGDTASNLAQAIGGSALGTTFSTAVQGGNLRITDGRAGASAIASSAFLVGFAAANAGAIAFTEDVAGVGTFVGQGSSADGFMIGTTALSNGSLPASIRDDEIDFTAAGVQVGDMIRFTTGNLAGSAARIVAVGQRADGTLDRNAITFEWEQDFDRAPSTIQSVNFFIHEAADVGIGVQSLVNPNVPPDGMDPSSPPGTLRISGNVGFENRIQDLQLTIKGSQGVQKLANFTELSTARGESFTNTISIYDSLGNAHNVRFTYYYEARSNADPAWRYIATSDDQVNAAGSTLNTVLGSGMLRFDVDGQLMDVGSDTQMVLELEDQGTRTPVIFDMDFTTMSSFAAEGEANQSDVYLVHQDGYEAGTLIDFSINDTGVVQGLFSNGLVRSIAQVAVARFANPNGLVSQGSNVFTQGVNSGDAIIGEAGQGGRGLVRSGFLEESNVELAEQFTDLITSQRAFQANARTITTASQLLQELVNLI
ncbi:MAG: flagellar hook-basal body complex protein [Planctomycetes bacterium]|nr:flagellar hook-basal body complex protein [Planctomycetota bacterium]